MRLRIGMGMLACLVVVAGGCGDDSPTTVVPTAGSVKLQFSHHVGGQDLVFNDIRYTNAAGQEYSVFRLNYLISNVEVLRSDGSGLLVPGPFFIDAEADSTLEQLLVSIPPDTYDRIRFTFGLDENDNHSGAFVNESWHGKMAWPDPLGGGYHYMILDGFQPSGLPAPDDRIAYNTHHGRTQTDPHYFRVTLDVDDFTVDGNTTCIEVAFDINEWYQNPNQYAFPDPAFIMDRPDVQQVLQANGASVFSAATVTP